MRRRWGSIFIKWVRGFEVKKAMNYELETHSHGGGEKKEENEEGKVVVVAEFFQGEKEGNVDL